MNAMGPQKRLKRATLWAGLCLILLLILFSIYGAFIGAAKAQAFFNSLPLSVYWLAFTLLLIAAIFVFGRLIHFQGLLMMHLGCVLVFGGGMWGSPAGFKLRDAIFNTDTLRTGQMVLHEGMTSDAVETGQGGSKTLPFSIRLVDFRLEHYDTGRLWIQTPHEVVAIAAASGSSCTLGGYLGSVEVVRRFANFKIIRQDDQQVVIDDPAGNSNPALELRLTRQDGTQTMRYVFERFEGHVRPEDNFRFRYSRAIRDYISDLEVIKEGTVVARKSIEVNHPLHFGGYFIYQQGYDHQAGRFTVLRITNDRGVGLVFFGYLLVCAGLLWHQWFRHLWGGRVLGTD